MDASFDGASELGMALIASDLGGGLGVEASAARDEVERMVRAANLRGEELVVSLMVTREVLSRMLSASHIDASTRIAVALWLEAPLSRGHFRVVAIAGEQVRAPLRVLGPGSSGDITRFFTAEERNGT